MKWTTSMALVLTAGAAALGIGTLLRPAYEDPRSLLERVERSHASGALDLREALRQLAAAIDSAELASDPEVAEGLYRARADKYRALGVYNSAREDLELVLNKYAPDDADLELDIAHLMALEGRKSDALFRTRRVVERNRGGARGYELLGRLEASVADESLELAVEKTLASVDVVGGARAAEILEELAAMTETDARGPDLVSELRAIFRPHVAAPLVDVLELMQKARDSGNRARAALSRSMSLAPTPLAAATLAKGLQTIGRPTNAGDLLLAGRCLPEIRQSPEIVSTALPILLETGRIARAEAIFASWDWSWGGDLEFYRQAATTLYQAGESGGVNRAAAGMLEVGGNLGHYWTLFYFPAAAIRAGTNARQRDAGAALDAEALRASARSLVSFLRRDFEPEPFAGARIEAWFLKAECHRLLGETSEERQALAQGLDVDPDHSADAWVRLADILLESVDVPWERVELYLTNALDVDPRTTPSLLERWLDAGARSLAADGLDFAEILADTRLDGDGRPLREVGPSVLWRVATSHAEEGRTAQANALAERLLERFPRLVPALDVKIRAQLKLGGTFDVTRDILRRIELVGSDAVSDGFLAAVTRPLRGSELLAAMRAAPERFGRPAAAYLAAREGDPRRAADLLEDLAAVESTPALQIARGRARLAAGRHDEAAADFSALLDDPRAAHAAIEGWIDARLARPDVTEEELAPVVARILASPIAPEGQLRIARAVTAGGFPDLGKRILAPLDRGPETRTPDFYRALVLAASAAGDRAATAEAIARASAYVLDGTPEIAELLEHVEARRWTSLPATVARLRATEFRATPLQEAALTLLEERLAAGRRLAERSRATHPRSAEWALLRAICLALEGETIDFAPWFGERAAEEAVATLLGDARSRRDPREVLASLLLLDSPEWHPLAEAKLATLGAQGAGTLWPLWLRSALARRSGDGSGGRDELAGCLRGFPDFGPAWDVHVADVRARHLGDPLAKPLLEARFARFGALGARVLEDPVEIALATASRHVLRGEDEPAATELFGVLKREEREEFEPRFMLASVLARAGQHGLAVNHLRSVVGRVPKEWALPYVDLALQSLERASSLALEQRAPVPHDQLRARYEELARHFPTDPKVALVLAKHGSDPQRGLSLRAAGARREMNRLRSSLGEATLESKRRGSTREWVDFTLELAPELAREIVAADLARRPEDIELWELGAEIETALGHHREARELYHTVLSIEPSTRACHAYAEILLRDGARDAEVVELMIAADHAFGRVSMGSQYLTAKLRARHAYPQFEAMTNELQAIFDKRETADGTVDVVEVGLSLASALLQWAGDVERQRAQVTADNSAHGTSLPLPPSPEELAKRAQLVLERTAPLTKDPYVLPLIAALEGLCRALITPDAGVGLATIGAALPPPSR